MTDRVRQALDRYLDRGYRADRATEAPVDPGRGDREPLCYEASFLAEYLAAERPLLRENDAFGFNRTLPSTVLPNGNPKIKTANVTPDYGYVIRRGFDGVREDIARAAAGKPTALHKAILICLDAGQELAARYRAEAERTGNTRLAEALTRLPMQPAVSFYDACLMQKILIFMFRAAAYIHVTLGRFDQYMYPYWQADRARGVPEEELFETLELYFVSLNMDTDLYFGLQVGDNGQSMVLCGRDSHGNDQTNELSYRCLDAACELSTIDPKINVRVDRRTPLSFYERCTDLTAKGLGFPQYSNDDVVIPGLIALGYDPEDACDYSVAACWEFIIPGKGMDIPNFDSLNFPLVVGNAVREHLASCADFESLMEWAEKAVIAACDAIVGAYRPPLAPSPLISLMTEGCIASGRDVSENAAKYNNNGSHGTGVSTAADILSAVRRVVYEEKSVTPEELLTALDRDFEGYTALRNRLLDCPKMGNDDPATDAIGYRLLNCFAEHLNGRPNDRGGIWRAGTGSAQNYIYQSLECPATADGRKAFTPYPCSFSPAPTARPDGPLSVIRSFTGCDLSKIINGGPLTLELHDTVFRNRQGYEKVAALVKLFIDRGGHQLQLNAVNRDRLLRAKADPASDPNLIVRVWGWSGYFCELDEAFQDQIIRRTEYLV